MWMEVFMACQELEEESDSTDSDEEIILYLLLCAAWFTTVSCHTLAKSHSHLMRYSWTRPSCQLSVRKFLFHMQLRSRYDFKNKRIDLETEIEFNAGFHVTLQWNWVFKPSMKTWSMFHMRNLKKKWPRTHCVKLDPILRSDYNDHDSIRSRSPFSSILI